MPPTKDSRYLLLHMWSTTHTIQHKQFHRTYSTVYSTLQGLSHHGAQITEAIGRNPNSWPILHLDNIQSYSKRCDLRMGWVNQLRIGTAGTMMEAEDFLPAAMDGNERWAGIVENRQKDLTVPLLLALVDNTHADIVGALQWLRILVHYVPEQSRYKAKVSELGFGMGIPWVGIFHTVPVTGTGTYCTVICTVSHGYHTNPCDI
jgi:hypothetical protein